MDNRREDCGDHPVNGHIRCLKSALQIILQNFKGLMGRPSLYQALAVTFIKILAFNIRLCGGSQDGSTISAAQQTEDQVTQPPNCQRLLKKENKISSGTNAEFGLPHFSETTSEQTPNISTRGAKNAGWSLFKADFELRSSALDGAKFGSLLCFLTYVRWPRGQHTRAL